MADAHGAPLPPSRSFQSLVAHSGRFASGALSYICEGARSKSAQQMVAATIHTAFVQPDPDMARHTWRQVAESFAGRYPKLAKLLEELEEAERDVLAYLAFPSDH